MARGKVGRGLDLRSIGIRERAERRKEGTTREQPKITYVQKTNDGFKNVKFTKEQKAAIKAAEKEDAGDWRLQLKGSMGRAQELRERFTHENGARDRGETHPGEAHTDAVAKATGWDGRNSDKGHPGEKVSSAMDRMHAAASNINTLNDKINSEGGLGDYGRYTMTRDRDKQKIDRLTGKSTNDKAVANAAEDHARGADQYNRDELGRFAEK